MTKKKRNKSSFKRLPPSRYASEKVLIVCEGAKTEPAYFDYLCRRWGLTGPEVREVEIHGDDCGSAPKNIVDKALELRTERDILARRSPVLSRYDTIWCVFDRNGHTTYHEAKDKAEANKIKVACSVPCFEFWFILHFERSSRQYANCTEAIKYLEGHIGRKYTKGKISVMVEYYDDLKEAVSRARWLRKQGCGDPYTNVDELVTSLAEIAKASGRI